MMCSKYLIFLACIGAITLANTLPIPLRFLPHSKGGSLDFDIHTDQFGPAASIRYNHNLYTSENGQSTVDAYAQGLRNFRLHRNDFSGGIRGSLKF